MLANRFETKNEEKNDDGREKSEVNGNFENDKNHHTNKSPEGNKGGARVGFRMAVNRIKSYVSQVFVVGWAGLLALWSTPFLTEHYQKLANSHIENAQWFEMGPVFLLSLIFTICSLVNKRYFVAVLNIIIVAWSFYWTFFTSFSCNVCPYVG